MLIFRDDDAPIHDVKDFIFVHELLSKYNRVHTVALICRNLDRYPKYIDYIKNRVAEFDLQFHCLDHIDHTQNHDIIFNQFAEGTEIFFNVFGFRPTVWYPTWNLCDEYSINAAANFGMETSFKKYSLSQVIRKPGAIDGVINFHHWSKEEREQLEPALIALNDINNL